MRSLLRPLTFHLLVTQPLFLTVSADLYSNITVGKKTVKQKNPPLVGLVILIVQHERAASVSHKATSSQTNNHLTSLISH